MHGQTYTSAYCEDFFMYFKSSIRHSGNIFSCLLQGNGWHQKSKQNLKLCALYIKTQSKNQISHAYKEKQRKCVFFSVSCDIFAVFLFSLTLALTSGTSGANQDVKKRKILSNLIRSLKPFKKTVLGKR